MVHRRVAALIVTVLVTARLLTSAIAVSEPAKLPAGSVARLSAAALKLRKRQ